MFKLKTDRPVIDWATEEDNDDESLDTLWGFLVNDRLRAVFVNRHSATVLERVFNKDNPGRYEIKIIALER
jgi:hypothetical protein